MGELKGLRKYVCKQLSSCLWAEAFPPSHSWLVGVAQLLSNSHITKMFSGWSFPIFQLFTPRKSFVMSTQTDKARGRSAFGTASWSGSLWPCCSSHTGRVWDWPRRPRALLQASIPATHATHEGSLLHSCKSQGQKHPALLWQLTGRGKRFTGEDTTQEAAVPRAGDSDPSPKPCVIPHAHTWDCVGQSAGPPGAQGFCLADC